MKEGFRKVDAQLMVDECWLILGDGCLLSEWLLILVVLTMVDSG